MNSISAQYDPINAGIDAFLHADELAESRDDAVSDIAAEVAAAPAMNDFADAVGSLGFTQEHLQKLLSAYMTGRDAFMTEVYEQLDGAFRDIADLKLTRLELEPAHGREVLSDWE